MADATQPEQPRLPSCRECRQRKVKCDSQRPRCGTCLKLNSSCDFVDSSTNERFSGDYIHQLEKEQEQLRVEIERHATAPVQEENGANDGSEDLRERVEVNTGSSGKIQAGGISFLRLLFSDPDWRQRNADLLQKFAQRPVNTENSVAPNPLPSYADAQILVNRYLSGSHVQNPFLLRSDVESTLHRVYHVHSPTASPAKHDLFNIFMLCAIGSVVAYRNGQHSQHPFGYYLAALEHFNPDFLGAGLQGIQDILLIARFGIYYHIGTSIWDIAQICIRMCIEQGLHRKQRNRINCKVEQLQRRIFWHCYVIDRYSSTTLGRPFAIAEHEITVPYPVRVNDVDLEVFQGHLDEIPSTQDLNDMSIFLFYLELRRITSQIYSAFNKAVKSSTSQSSLLFLNGKVHVELHNFLSKLAYWRSTAPIYSEPTCLYHRPEWRDFMYERYRLLVLRAAVDAVPKLNGFPPRELIEMIADSSTELILLYSGMYEKGYITFTRSYFQMLFTGGLSLMFAFAVMSQPGEFKLQGSSAEALRICENLLMRISEQLQDSQYYTAIFEALRRETLRRSSLVYQQGLTSTAPTRRGSNTMLEQDVGQTDQMHQSSSGMYNSETQAIESLHSYQNQHVPLSMMAGQNNGTSDNIPFFDITYPYSDPYANPTNSLLANHDFMYQLGGFSDEWLSMEAGLGEYAYGDNYANLGIWDQIQLDLNSG